MGGKASCSLLGALIKSVLCSIPVHTLAAIPIPKLFLSKLEKIFAQFLLSSAGEYRHHWLAWSTICKPYKEGCLGIRPFGQVMSALHAKLAWSYMQGHSLWSTFMRSKYGEPARAIQQPPSRSSSSCSVGKLSCLIFFS